MRLGVVGNYTHLSHHHKKTGVKMNWLICSAVLFLSTIFFPVVCWAVDKSSSSYKAGQIFSIIVLIIIIYLLIKKMRHK